MTQNAGHRSRGTTTGILERDRAAEAGSGLELPPKAGACCAGAVTSCRLRGLNAEMCGGPRRAMAPTLGAGGWVVASSDEAGRL